MDKPTSVESSKESMKRQHEDSENESDEQDALSAGAIAQMTRSERKRHREKKRRSDVNKGFDDLTALLWEIDPAVRVENEERANRLQSKGSSGGPPEASMLSRVDLISRAVQLIRRLHTENEQNKCTIAALTRQGGGGFGAEMSNLHLLAEQNSRGGVSQLNIEVSDPALTQLHRFSLMNSNSNHCSCLTAFIFLKRGGTLRQPFLNNNPLLNQPAALESHPLYNQQLLQRLIGLQTESSRHNPQSSQELINRIVAQNVLQHGSVLGNPSLNIAMGSRVGIDGPSSSLFRNPNVNIAELSEQQLRRTLANIQTSGNNANLAAAMASNRNAEHASGDMTRNLIRILQERQAAAGADLAVPDALVHQRPGSGNDSFRQL